MEQKSPNLNYHLLSRTKKAERRKKRIIGMISKKEERREATLMDFWKEQSPETPCSEVSASIVDIFKNK